MKSSYLKIILTAILFTGAVSSCREKAIEIDSLEKELFLRESREGIYKNGEVIFAFDENRHQKAINSRRIQYRIQTDLQDTCLNVILESLPESAGVHITTSIDYRSPGEFVSSMSHLECSRASEDKLWLWNSSSLTGIILDISQM